MPTLLVKLRNDPRSVTREETRALAKILTKSFKVGAELLKSRGRAAISAGNLGGEFQSGWKVKSYPKSGASLSPKIFAHHTIFYAGEFQNPDTITGHPFLWLPIERNLPGGGRWTPKKFVAAFGPLRGGRRGGGRPILFGQVAVGHGSKPLKRKPRDGAKPRKIWLPVFVGVSAVRDPKRFDLVGVAESVAGDIGSTITKALS